MDLAVDVISDAVNLVSDFFRYFSIFALDLFCCSSFEHCFFHGLLILAALLFKSIFNNFLLHWCFKLSFFVSMVYVTFTCWNIQSMPENYSFG